MVMMQAGEFLTLWAKSVLESNKTSPECSTFNVERWIIRAKMLISQKQAGSEKTCVLRLDSGTNLASDGLNCAEEVVVFPDTNRAGKDES
mmetsp:Transcript_106162/g.226607  ORF Transcript_106162/g.226607 Transcript_106162/m.226607 type:complete len:90 (+) Transcript_106162:317-586(+)